MTAGILMVLAIVVGIRITNLPVRAASDGTAAMTAVDVVPRKIEIICDAERLAFMPDKRPAGDMKIIKFGRNTEDSLDELVSAVWERIDSWGPAIAGRYWRPKLVMMIEPGGQGRYTDLQSLLAGSGFDVHGRPRTVKRR